MKNIYFTLLIIPIVLFAGCSSKKLDLAIDYGQGVFNEITISETKYNPYAFKKINNKEIIITVESTEERNKYQLVINDGKFKNREIVNDLYLDQAVFELYEDDIYFISHKKFSINGRETNSNTGRKINIYRLGTGIYKEFPIDDYRGSNDSSVKDILLGKYINLIYEDGIQIVDYNGKTVAEYFNKTIFSACLGEDDSLYILRYDYNAYWEEKILYNGNIAWSIMFEENKRVKREILYDKNSKILYIISDMQIDAYDANGKFLYKVADFYYYDIKDKIIDGWFFRHAIMMDTNSFIFKIEDPNHKTENIIKFIKADGMEATNLENKIITREASKKQINIVMPYVNAYQEDMFYLYEKFRSGVKINIITYSDNGLTASKQKEEYTQFVNLQLMSGTKIDIIFTQFLPYLQYIKKGLFADVSEIKKSAVLFDEKSYFQNILNACKYDNKLYIIPMLISFDLWGYNPLITNKYNLNLKDGISINEFFNISDKILNDGKTVMRVDNIQNDTITDNNVKFDRTFKSLYPVYCNEINNYKENIFNEEALSEFLDVLHSIINSDIIKEDTQSAFLNSYYSIGHYQDISMLLNKFMVEGYMPMNIPCLDNQKIVFNSLNFAISSESDNKEEALDFILYVINHEDRYITPSIQSFKDNLANEMRLSSAKAISNMESCILPLNTLTYNEASIESIIREESQKYVIRGSAKEAIFETIKSKINLYLME